MLRCQMLMRGAVLVMFTVNVSGGVRCCAISLAWREPIGFVVVKDKECDSRSCFSPVSSSAVDSPRFLVCISSS